MASLTKIFLNEDLRVTVQDSSAYAGYRCTT